MAGKPCHTKTVELIDKALHIVKQLGKKRVLDHDSRSLVLHCFFTLARYTRVLSLTDPIKAKTKVAELLGFVHCTVSKIQKH